MAIPIISEDMKMKENNAADESGVIAEYLNLAESTGTSGSRRSRETKISRKSGNRVE